jgi:hypothetical protein
VSEGPQVQLRTEWLDRQLNGRTLLNAKSGRAKLRAMVPLLDDRLVRSCFCKGKHTS